MNPDLVPGGFLPDLELPDHSGITRTLTELAEGDPLVVNFFRGWWCPKEQTAQVAPDRAPLFDDPAVSGALRAVLSGQWLDAVTTFVRDSSHFAGSMCVSRTDPGRLRDYPFARIRRAVLLRVESGLLARVAPPPGPLTQRYSGLPWPAAGF